MAKAHEKPTDESIKDTLQSVVIAFVLAFLFRAYVVEAFVIPTGSMAPTLLGKHFAVTCRQCGYHFSVGASRRVQSPPRGAEATCPMCHYPNPRPAIGGPRSGDRIMVQKYIYDFVAPRRWDVVVFNAPHKPETHYIKRLVGLPGETLAILDGNLYVKPSGGDWRIARKTNRPQVQRRVFQPIYHSQFIPRDLGENRVVGPAGGSRSEPEDRWAHPWVADQPDHWRIEGRRAYRYDGEGAGRLRFRFTRGGYHTGASLHPYNQSDEAPSVTPIEDIRLAASVEPAESGTRVTLQTTARLGKPGSPGTVETLAATVGPDRVSLTATNDQTGETRTLAEQPLGGSPFADSPTDLELWYVDQEAILWIDGEQVLSHAYNLPPATLKARPGPPPTPEPAIRLSGAGTLHRVELDRDLYYTSQLSGLNRGRGVLRRVNGEVRGEPFQLEADQFFCLGDNSPNSQDSRFWDPAAPWIRERILNGRKAPGIVPRDLMVGRAFFVYWPAPYTLPAGGGLPVLPNFAEMRFIK